MGEAPQRIEQGEGVAVLEAAWRKLNSGRRPCACFGASGPYNDLPTLRAIVDACPGAGLACIMRLMARHYAVRAAPRVANCKT